MTAIHLAAKEQYMLRQVADSMECNARCVRDLADGNFVPPPPAPPPVPYMPTADEAFRFMQSNPDTAMGFLVEILKASREDSRCSNGRLRDIWKQSGGMVDKKQRAWIEADLLPGLMRLLSEIPPSKIF